MTGVLPAGIAAVADVAFLAAAVADDPAATDLVGDAAADGATGLRVGAAAGCFFFLVSAMTRPPKTAAAPTAHAPRMIGSDEEDEADEADLAGVATADRRLLLLILLSGEEEDDGAFPFAADVADLLADFD